MAKRPHILPLVREALGEEPSPDLGLESVRREILDTSLLILGVCLLPALGAVLVRSLHQGSLGAMTPMVLMAPALVGLFLARDTLRDRWRAHGLVLSFYIVATSMLWTAGLSLPGGQTLSFMGALMATLLMGFRTGLGYGALSVGLIAAATLADATGWHRAPALVTPQAADRFRTTWLPNLLATPVYLFVFLLGFARLFHHLSGVVKRLSQEAQGRERAELERQALQEHLHQAQKLESLGRLAGGVAHDLNNVLGAILAAATVEQARGGASRSLDTIAKACLRGREVVQNLLQFARREASAQAPLDLNELVRELGSILAHSTLQRVHYVQELGSLPGPLRGDRGALSTALMNLYVNAVDALPPGGTLRVRTWATEEGGVAVEVEDNGAGMPPDVLDKALDPFFTTKAPGKGTGLGLAMAYGTARAHDARLELRSEVGRGTTVTLTFPASRILEAPLGAVEGGTEAEGTASLRVLVVDDDDLVRAASVCLLEALGHDARAVAAGEEALVQLTEAPPVDLVLLDVNMPGRTGPEVLEALRERGCGVPVLMMTGYSDTSLAPLLAHHADVAVLEKPFTLAELSRKLASLCPRSPGNARALANVQSS